MSIRLMSELWTIAAHKGGAGKTTTAASLAAVWADQGQRVLAIDLDGQGTLTRWLGAEPSAGLVDVYRAGARIEPIAQASTLAGVDIVASGPSLSDSAIAGDQLAVMALRRALDALDGPWDRVIIDTPPALGVLSTSALLAADYVITPCEASMLAVPSVPSTIEAIDAARAANGGSRPAFAGVLICRADRRTLNARSVEDALRGALGSDVLDTIIRDSVRLRDAAGLGQSILELDPTGHGAEDYKALADELARRVEG